MEQKIVQKQLFNPLELSIQNNLSIIELIKIGLDRPAFGVTKVNLKKGDLEILRCFFYGVHNLDFKNFLEMPLIEKPIEILSKVFAANGLTKENKHLNNPDIPDDFLEFMDYLDEYSNSNEKFVSFAKNFEGYLDIGQRRRLELLDQSNGRDFVRLFKHTKRKISNREDKYIYDFFDRNWDGIFDGRDRGKYADGIYEKLELLRQKARQKYNQFLWAEIVK